MHAAPHNPLHSTYVSTEISYYDNFLLYYLSFNHDTSTSF